MAHAALRRLSLLAVVTAMLLDSAASAQPLNFDVFAGSAPSAGSDDGTGTSARFAQPEGVAVDAAGNAYVADSQNHVIRRISPAGVVTTFTGVAGESGGADGRGGLARLASPFGIGFDAAGNLYVTDLSGFTIRRITPGGDVTTVAGLYGVAGTADGPVADARFDLPIGLAVDAAGTIYVTEFLQSTIRKISGGMVSTIAGQPGVNGSADGIGTAATFSNPGGIAVDASGTVYVADYGNATVRRIAPDGNVTTIAGQAAGPCGSADGVGTAATFCSPWGLALDAAGRNLYITDDSNELVRRMTLPGLVVTTVAGAARVRGSVDGSGTAARFDTPESIAVGPGGALLVTEVSNNDVRRIVLPGAVVTRLAGTPASIGTADGVGTAAQFDQATAIAWDGTQLVVADTMQHTIRAIDLSGNVTTLAGRPGANGSADGLGTSARFNLPYGIGSDGAGTVYVADTFNRTIRRISAGGAVSTWAGQALTSGSTDGAGAAARFRLPRGVTADALGNVYVADSGNATIRKIDAFQNVTTLAGLARTTGTADGNGSAARFRFPWGIAVDVAGSVYVSDVTTIRRISPSGDVVTIAGSPSFGGSADGTGSAARFASARGIWLDPAGDLIIADSGNVALRKMTPAGVVTTIAGDPGHVGNSAGTGRDAHFYYPGGVTTDSAGRIYVADSLNCDIRASSAALDDRSVVDSTLGRVGDPRQLDTLPQTATGWQWSLARQPSFSTAAISSTSIRNPTFTPDIGDVFTFRLDATGGALTNSTLVTLGSAVAPVITRDVSHQPSRGQVGQPIVFHVQGLVPPAQAAFSDGAAPTVAATSLALDASRGVLAVRVPPGAQTGFIKVTASRVDSPSFFFRVEPGSFAQGTDIVSGTVTGPGGPVAGAIIALLVGSGCGGQDVHDVATTDATGAYTATGLDGAATIVASAPSSFGLANGVASVTLAAGPTMQDFTLVPGTTVTGVVTSGSSGAPLDGARLEWDSGPAIETTLTQRDGTFTVHLAPADWSLEVHAPVGTSLASSRSNVTIGPASPQDLGTRTLDAGVLIRGRLRSASDGTPLSSADVSAQVTSPCCADVDRQVAGGDGVFTLVVPPNGTYDVQASVDARAPFAAARVPVATVTTTVGQDISLAAASIVMGRVTDSGGAPLGCAAVQATTAPWPGTLVAEERTCSDGTYALRVPPGASYLVSTLKDGSADCAAAPDYATQTWNAAGGTYFPCEGVPVAVGPAGSAVPGIDFVLPLAATVEGSFLTQSSGCVSLEPAVGPSTVTIDDGSSHPCGMGTVVATAPPGTYRIELLPPSTVITLRACVSPPAPYAPQCWNARTPPMFDAIAVAPGATASGDDFCLAQGASGAPTRPLTGVRVRKSGGNLVMTWDPSTDPNHAFYRVRRSPTASPSTRPGTFPTDPAFADVSGSDLDGSSADTTFSLPLADPSGFFLVTDASPAGEGPSESYGG